MRYLGLLLALALLLPAAAEDRKVYRWVDKDGVVHYTDRPPSENARPADLPELQTYRPLPSPAVPTPAPVPAEPAPLRPVQLQIVSPQPDETFRDAQRTVSIVVNAPSADDLRFIYYLDGKPLTEPIAASSFTAVGIDRGSHAVSVAAVDRAGRELGRAGPVTIHMKPPIIRRPPASPPGNP